jgi:hypothetical protein
MPNLSHGGKRFQVGPRGDGRDGVGQIGPRGEPGPMGPPVVPAYTTGEKGVPISLRPFFEQYDQSTRGDEDDA